jgi:hypothetical protein
MGMTTTQTSEAPHLRSLILAAVIYLFGEKSDVLAKLVLQAYNGAGSSAEWAYEATMLGLAFGTALVVSISAMAQDQNRADDWTLIVGICTATLAGCLSILEVWLDPDKPVATKQLRQTLFFYVLWVFLVIAPLVRTLSRHQVLRGSGVITFVMVFVIVACLGLILEQGVDLVVWPVLQRAGVDVQGSFQDAQVFKAHTLLILVSCWAVTGFGPQADRRWRVFYAFGAVVAAFSFPVLMDKADNWRLILFFPALSLVSLLPLWNRVPDLLQGRSRGALAGSMPRVGGMAGVTCAFFWIPDSYRPVETAVVAASTAVAGLCVPLALWWAGGLLRRFGVLAKES